MSFFIYFISNVLLLFHCVWVCFFFGCTFSSSCYFGGEDGCSFPHLFGPILFPIVPPDEKLLCVGRCCLRLSSFDLSKLLVFQLLLLSARRDKIKSHVSFIAFLVSFRSSDAFFELLLVVELRHFFFLVLMYYFLTVSFTVLRACRKSFLVYTRHITFSILSDSFWFLFIKFGFN